MKLPSSQPLLLLLPALVLLLTGLVLHPMAPADALQLLQSDPAMFLVLAGPVGRMVILLGAVIVLLAALAASLLSRPLSPPLARRPIRAPGGAPLAAASAPDA